MAHVFNRGTKHDPKWYVRFKDRDGRWVSRPSQQPTKALAEQVAHQIAARVVAGKVGIEEPEAEPPSRVLMQEWAESLHNRNASDDRSRFYRHVLPVFGDRPLKALTLPLIMKWLDRMRAEGKLAPASQRHCLNNLSRFFSWAIEQGHTTIKPGAADTERTGDPSSRSSVMFRGSITMRRCARSSALCRSRLG